MHGYTSGLERLDAMLEETLISEKELTDLDVEHLIRGAIASEYEAIQFYQKIAERVKASPLAAKYGLVIKIMESVAREEKIHAGEFLRVLVEVNPDEADLYGKGSEEVVKTAV